MSLTIFDWIFIKLIIDYKERIVRISSCVLFFSIEVQNQIKTICNNNISGKMCNISILSHSSRTAREFLFSVQAKIKNCLIELNTWKTGIHIICSVMETFDE